MPTNKHEALYNEACNYLTGGLSRNTVYRYPHPIYAAKASGCYVTDMEGVERIDFANNMAALIHGHAHPTIVEAVIEQLQKGTAYTTGTVPEIELAKHLNSRQNAFEIMRFVNSGTEAVMAMMKASRAYTGKPKIAKAEGAYHGTSNFAEVSQAPNPDNWGDIDSPNSVAHVHGTPQGLLDNVVIFPFNDIKRTLAILDRHAKDIACVMLDPVPHRVGLCRADDAYIEALYHWTRKNNALLVFDEVVTFRVSYGGGQESYKVKPDMTALGKIIGGGFPVGALCGREDVMKVLDPRQPKIPFPHSGTFSANPITMTAGLTAMKLFDREAVKKLNALTDIAVKQIREAIKLSGVPASVTGAGSMFRIHLRPNSPTTYREAYRTPDRLALIQELLDYMLYEEKIMFINTLSCMLSTAITQKEVDRLSEGFYRALLNKKDKIMALQKNTY